MTRRRGEALEDALLDAAWDELVEVGYGRFTIDGVAARAGTSRPVIYRRWPVRSDLAIAAVRRRAGRDDRGDRRRHLPAPGARWRILSRA
jgi:AcrR family transcriptional regulator